MANFSSAFGYRTLIVPLLQTNVDFADLALGGVGAGKFIDDTTVWARTDAVATSGTGGTFQIDVGGTPTTLALDGSDNPFRLLGLNECSLDTTTGEEEVITYDDETQGFEQAQATSKGFTLSLAGVADFADSAYKIMRLVEKLSVAEGLMCKMARVGPTGSTEAVYGFGRINNYQEGNAAGATVRWTAEFAGYGAYGLDFST